MKRLMSAALIGASIAANAATYVESADLPGGISFGPGAVSVGTLDVGGNTVSGSLNGACVLGPGGCNSFSNVSFDSQDSFLLTVAAGTQLDSVIVSNSGTTGPADFSASFYLTNETGSMVHSMPLMPINGTSANVLNLPLAAGVYSLTVYGQTASEAGSYVLPYTLSLSVSAVPEPASAGLLLCGGLLLAAARRRRG